MRDAARRQRNSMMQRRIAHARFAAALISRTSRPAPLQGVTRANWRADHA
jgi:hypothetical protein